MKVNSSKPKKQRKLHYGKALHLKQHGLAAHLDKKLRHQLGLRSIPARKGDTVKVLRGSKRGASGKITGVDYEKGVVFVEKLVRKKANGEEIPLPVHASNLLITDVERGDSKRFKGKKLQANEKPAKEEKVEKKAEGKKPEKGKEKVEEAKKEEKDEKKPEKAKEKAGKKDEEVKEDGEKGE